MIRRGSNELHVGSQQGNEILQLARLVGAITVDRAYDFRSCFPDSGQDGGGDSPIHWRLEDCTHRVAAKQLVKKLAGVIRAAVVDKKETNVVVGR